MKDQMRPSSYSKMIRTKERAVRKNRGCKRKDQVENSNFERANTTIQSDLEFSNEKFKGRHRAFDGSVRTT